MAIELATAYVPLVPSMKGAHKNIARELNSSAIQNVASQSGQSMGSRLAGGLGRTMKAGAKVAAVGVGSVLGTAVVKGFGRLAAIENAEAKLKGLGNSGEATAEIMANALSSVKGTAFGMDEAATTAASAVAAGIAPGKELTGYLGLVGDAATIGGTSLAEMGSIFNKVATSGKVQGDVFAQLGDIGIPIVQMLSKELGVTAEEVYKMGSKGEISSDQFLTAMSSIKGAALESGNTTTGAFKNMGAALSRFGAELISGIYPLMGPAFNRVTEMLDGLTEKVGPLAEAFSIRLAEGIKVAAVAVGRFVTPLKDIGNLEILTPDIVKRMGLSPDSPLGKGMTELIGGVRAFSGAWKAADGDVTSSGFPGFMERSAFAIQGLWSTIQGLDFSSWDGFKSSLGQGGGQIADSFGRIGKSLADLRPAFAEFGAQLPEIGSAVGKLAVAGISLLADTLVFLASHVDTIIKFMPLIVAGFVAWRVATVAGTIATHKLMAAQVAMAPVLMASNAMRLTATILEGRQAAAKTRSTVATTANTVATAGNTTATASNNVAQSTGVIAKTRSAAALVAQRVAMVATTVATRAMAAGQWLLNAALTANPIGLVIVALVALGVGIVTAYNKVGWFKDFVDRSWALIKRVTANVFGWIKDVAFPAFRSALDSAGQKVMWLYNNAIKPAFDWARNKISGFIGFFGDTKNRLVSHVGAMGAKTLGLYNDHVRPAWDNMRNKITGVWDSIRTKAFNPMVKFVKEDIPNAFKATVKGVGDIWNGLKGAVKAPVKFVISDVINDVLIAGYNKLNNFWDGKDIDPIPLPRGFRTGGYTGNMGKDEVAGLVHGQEQVIRAESTADVERRMPGFLDDLNNRGAAALARFGHEGHDHGGMAAGGPGGPGTYLWGQLQNRIYSSGRATVSGSAPGYDLGAAARAWNNMSNLKVGFGAGPNMIRVGSGAPAGTWGYAWSDGRIKLNSGIPGNMKVGVAAHEIGHVLGLDHAGTNSIMHPMMRGPLWPSAFDRKTVQRIYGGAGNGNPPEGGGGPSPLERLMDLASKPLDGILNKFSGNNFADMALGIGKKVLEGLKSKVGAAAHGPGDEIVPELHDNGGTIHPGLNVIMNRTRKAEQSLNPDQWTTTKQALATLQNQAQGGGDTNLYVENMFGTPKGIVDEVEKRQRRANSSAGIRRIGKVGV